MPVRVLREAVGRVSGDGVELAFGFWPGRGNPVIALHGITANYLNFIGVAECLRGRRPLLAFDLRGRGDSDKPAGPYGLAQHGRDVAAAMRELSLGPSLVVGHSMGAFVATSLAADYPDLVSGLLLVDGGYVVPSSLAAPPGDTNLNPALAQRIQQLSQEYPSREEYRSFWRTQPNFPPSDWNCWLERFLDYEVGGNGPVRPKALQPAVITDLMEGLKKQEILGRLKRIRVPTIMLRAETGFTPQQPPLYPDEVAAGISEYVQHISEKKIAGTTHYTIVIGERGAQQVADIIDEFAATLAPGSAQNVSS